MLEHSVLPPSRTAGSAVPLPAHDGAVVGVGIDSCNRLMVTGGVDQQLRVWDFKVGAWGSGLHWDLGSRRI